MGDVMISIKQIKELEGITNAMYTLTINLYAEVNVINRKTGNNVFSTSNVEDLADYGFEVRVLKKAPTEILELIADIVDKLGYYL